MSESERTFEETTELLATLSDRLGFCIAPLAREATEVQRSKPDWWKPQTKSLRERLGG